MRRNILLVLFSLQFLLWIQQAEARKTMNVEIGKGSAIVAFLEGVAHVTPEGADVSHALKVNDLLNRGDRITTGPKTKMELILPDRSMLRFAQNTRFRLVAVEAAEEQPRDIKVHVAVGKAWAKVSKAIGGKGSFALTCENAVAGVRGTVYRVNVEDDKSVLIRVYDGVVFVDGGGNKTLDDRSIPVGSPTPIAGPAPIAGPTPVSMEEWTFIVKAMQQIMVKSDGKPGKPVAFTEQEDRDSWVDWNKERDLDSD